MEEEKVTLQVSHQTLRMIEAAREKLSKKERFSWLKHLSVEEFLDFFFGFSEISDYCRRIFFETLNEVTPKDVSEVKGEKATVREVSEEEAIIVTEHQKKVVDVLKDAPLTVSQVARLTGLSKGQVNWILDSLKKKGVVERVKGTHEWKLVESAYSKIKVHRPLKDRILEVLRSTNRPMPTVEISRRLNTRRDSVSDVLWKLYKEGLVERIPISHAKTAWKLATR